MNDLTQAAWLLLTNPNVSFLLLVLGLWCVVFSVSVPGTGLPEVTAVVSLALAAIGLLQLPINWVGLGLIGLALVLFVLEFQVNSHGALTVGGAIALAVGALAVYRGDERSSAQLSWITVIGAPLVTALFFGWLIRQGLAAQRAPALHAERLHRLIGQVGVARTEVEREGSVYVGGELWSATADQCIPPETDVVVLERRGLVLKVAPAANGHPSPAAQPAGEKPAAP
jgi:membrane-bound serine protease (ClpP class)